VLDSDGNSLIGTGRVVELVSRRPFPGMTRGFVGEPDRYIETYWTRYPGIWCHGDWASVDGDGSWFLHGRSDDTINVAGKRVGPAELESVAIDSPVVTEAAAVGVPHPVKGEVPWIVCAATSLDASTTSAAAREIAEDVSTHIGKSFRPDRIVFVTELPKTRSGKIVRRAIRATIVGEDIGDLSGIDNPEALDELRSVVWP
jgi:acetyl-CoA synthetase